MTAIEPSQMKVVELRAELAALNLPTKGKKAELIARLEEARAMNEEVPADAEEASASPPPASPPPASPPPASPPPASPPPAPPKAENLDEPNDSAPFIQTPGEQNGGFANPPIQVQVIEEPAPKSPEETVPMEVEEEKGDEMERSLEQEETVEAQVKEKEEKIMEEAATSTEKETVEQVAVKAKEEETEVRAMDEEETTAEAKQPEAAKSEAPDPTVDDPMDHQPEHSAPVDDNDAAADYGQDELGRMLKRRDGRSEDDRRSGQDRRDRSRDRSRDAERRSRRDRSRERSHRSDRSRDLERHERRRDRSRDAYRSSGRDRRDRSRDRRDRSRDRHSSRREDRRSRRSPSPRHSRGRSLTPIHKRKRKLNNWDVPPPGFEHLSAKQVKMSGVFAPRGPIKSPTTPHPVPSGMNPERAAMMAQQPLDSAPLPVPPPLSAGSRGPPPALGPPPVNPLVSRQSRRLYIGNVPFGVSESDIISFFNTSMHELKLGASSSEDPVVSAQVSVDKNFAFVEFRTPEAATAALAFDGITFRGQSLKVRRPKDYVPPPGAAPEVPRVHLPGVISTNVPDSPHKLYVGGLPTHLTEEQVIELLKTFGEVRALNLVRDAMTNVPKGFAFCEYVNPAAAEVAVQGLNGMDLGDRKLVVQRANIPGTPQRSSTSGPPMPPPPFPLPPIPGMPLPPPPPPHLLGLLPGGAIQEPTTVLQLLNMVSPEELANDEEYQDIVDDIKEECEKFGDIEEVRIPRQQGDAPVMGVGKVFIRYKTRTGCTQAFRSLAGRKFADRTVLTSYITEESFYAEDY